MGEMLKRLKEMLEENIEASSKVFIVGHNDPDYDCIGSALGISALSKNMGKETYIIVDEDDIEIDPGVKKILDESKEKHNIINLEEFEDLVDDNSLLITADVNKKYLVSVREDLDKFKRIVVIDHHQEDEKTIETPNKIIDPKASSVSEIIAQVLQMAKIKYDQEIANYLLAGIVLDTKRYIKNTTRKTFEVTERLMRNGADSDYVNSLFLTEFDEDGRIQLLIHTPGNTNLQEYAQISLFDTRNVTFTINREKPKEIYRKVDIAKAADKMLKYRIADASFVLAHVKEGVVSISARSRSDIDVGQIMKHMENGGGNSENAGGRVESDDIFAVEKELMQQIQWGLPLEPPSEKIKVKKIRNK